MKHFFFTKARVHVNDVIGWGSHCRRDRLHKADARTRECEVFYLLIHYIPPIYSVDPLSAAQHNNSHTVSIPTIFAAREQNGEEWKATKRGEGRRLISGVRNIFGSARFWDVYLSFQWRFQLQRLFHDKHFPEKCTSFTGGCQLHWERREEGWK